VIPKRNRTFIAAEGPRIQAVMISSTIVHNRNKIPREWWSHFRAFAHGHVDDVQVRRCVGTQSKDFEVPHTAPSEPAQEAPVAAWESHSEGLLSVINLGL